MAGLQPCSGPSCWGCGYGETVRGNAEHKGSVPHMMIFVNILVIMMIIMMMNAVIIVIKKITVIIMMMIMIEEQ